ncbi:MAG: hypothetical protein JW819_06930, partial [Candidatus Krumholzibacteriota bacterium]|nr:hypothetical protein [Candidatus Krumholzibacteriota bacterium]
MPRFLERFAPESRRGILLYTLLLAFLACLAGAAALWVEPEPAAPAETPAARGETAQPLPAARQAASAVDAFLAEQRGGLRDLAASDEAQALLAAAAMPAADAAMPAPAADAPSGAPALAPAAAPVSPPASTPALALAATPASAPADSAAAAPPALATADSAAAAPAGAARADTSAA